MKKILVIEEPESCETCPLRSYSDLMLMCTPMREAASDVVCPLKPLPQLKNISDRKITYEELRERIGWNACLDEILGETE